jgi:hypothetical protein
MKDETPAPTRLASDPSPHALEVQNAQAAADDVGKGRRAASTPCGDADSDLELLRGLVAAYGTEGVRRMLDSLK